MSNSWSLVDKEYLIENYSNLGPRICASSLGRSESSVRAAASRLSLKKSITKTRDFLCEQLIQKGITTQLIGKYINGDTITTFKCEKGHIFEQRPRSVIERNGRCPQCSSTGYSDTKSAILYLIRYDIEGEEVYKLGITNRTVKERVGKDFTTFSGDVCWTVTSNGFVIRSLETKLKQKYKDNQYNTGLLKSGNTETYDCYINKPEL